ncbi:MAG: GDP-mannose 4,6-dehydratase, partial [bacterium]
ERVGLDVGRAENVGSVEHLFTHRRLRLHVFRCDTARGRVRALDNLSTGRIENLAPMRDRIELIEADLCDAEVCHLACRDMEVVLHQAAIPSVPKSVDHPAQSHAANATGTLNLLIAARDAGCRRFIMAASSSAYGDTEVSPKVETLVPNPMSPYAVAKLAAEHYCRAFYQCYGLQTLALRYFNVFGPRQDPNSAYAAAISAFVTAILKDRRPTVYGDGEQTRDFTYVTDAVEATLAAVDRGRPGMVYNVGGGARVTINDTIEMLARASGVTPTLQYEAVELGDMRHTVADTTRAREELGWKPTFELEEGLAHQVSWLKGRMVGHEH